MRLPLFRTGACLLGAAIAVGAYLASRDSSVRPTSQSSSSPAHAVMSGDSDRIAQLSRQVEDLQRSLAAIKSQFASQQSQRAAPSTAAAGDSVEPDFTSLEAQRAAEAEQHRVYMTGVAEAFGNEKIDPVWASQVSSRVRDTFEHEEDLRGIEHTVECRQQSCRVQIGDDGSGKLSGRMPMLALSLADVLPSISAEHIDQGNGHSALILYMSSQRPTVAAGSKK